MMGSMFGGPGALNAPGFMGRLRDRQKEVDKKQPSPEERWDRPTGRPATPAAAQRVSGAARPASRPQPPGTTPPGIATPGPYTPAPSFLAARRARLSRMLGMSPLGVIRQRLGG